MRRLILLTITAGLCAGTALAQDDAPPQNIDQNIQQSSADTPEAFDFERHDTNGDGYLTEAEWQDAGAATDFVNVDANADGYLEADEIRAVRNDTDVAQESPVASDEQATPEENYLGTGYDPLSADPADNEPVSRETEAAAADGIDREPLRTDDAAAAETSAIDNSLFMTRERDAEQSLSQLDSSRDGRISRQEAEQDDRAQENFVAWDRDQDGYLDQQEIDAGRNQETKGQEARETQQQDISFEEEDADGDGRIAREEATTMADFDTLDSNNDDYLDAAEVSYEPDERTVADAAGFEDFDTDSNGRLSRDEAANDAYINANFDAWDSDQDGYLEEEEVNNGWLEETSATPEEIW